MKPILRISVVFGVLSAHAAWAQTAATATPPSSAPATGAGNATSKPALPATPPAAAAPAPAAPAPAPAAPQVINLTPTPPAPTTPAKSGKGPDTAVGLSPSTPDLGGGTMLNNKEAATLTPSTGGAADEWKFDFHGYLRAPLRVSFGPATPLTQPSIYSTPQPDSYSPSMPPATSGFQLHSPPRVPGMLYTTWEYTNTVPGPWSQLNFSYGNSKVTATVIVDAYNETDGSYRNVQAQQGIDQAFITLNFPDVFKDYGGLVWNVGTFQNRYGAAGKYDGGMYETYLFGRTHQTGETLTATISNLDAHGDWTFTLEHGLGAKMDIVPFLNNANYQVFQNVPIGGTQGSPYLSDRSPDFLPYSGPVPMGSTFINHAHVGAKYQKTWTFGAHYIYVWTPDDNWSPLNSAQVDVSDAVPRANGPIQGSMTVIGPEVRFDGGAYGYGYLGWSHIDARNINAMADILEVLHSYGGYQFKQNFFGQTFNQHTGVYNGPENETGTVDNIMAQYTFSLGAWNRAPEDWWGDGPDLVLTAFGLLSVVDSKAPPIATTGGGRVAGDPSRATTWDMSTKKLKFGLDGLYTPLDWFGVGGRFDAVMPDLDDAYARTPGNVGGSSLDFAVLTAKAVIRTAFVTHESVTLEYQHYVLGKDAFAPYPYQWVPKADANLVSIYATMWW
ncbi:MAG TPA: hypothetical protein VH853_10105 [Polyangia bacterium]|jgi:hypothetical protein|nr:hypothetical protein [Polyangia bacterium]